ncbi:MAG: ROK family protein [Bacteroidota bacterium]|jgi:glucokinase
MKKKVVAGIDIGGTNTVYGIVNNQGNIINNGSVPTTHYKSPESLVMDVGNKILELLGEEYDLTGAGVGAPNANYFTGTVEQAPNLNWKGVVPLAEIFKETLNCPVKLTNDANAAALGEMAFGAAKGVKDFLFITLGTGLGSGIVVNGSMVYGHDGFAGELGHVIMFPEGRICGCGRKGCLETYCSATGIVRTYLSYFSENHFIDKKVDAKYIFNRARENEPEALKAFQFTAEILGLALANSVAYTSPEVIFIFGGLAQSGDLLMKPLKESFENNLLSIYKNKIKILESALPESSAAILGAASLCKEYLT